MVAASAIPTCVSIIKLPCFVQHIIPSTQVELIAANPRKTTTRKPTASPYSINFHQSHFPYHRGNVFKSKSYSLRTVLTRVSSDGGGAINANKQESATPDTEDGSSSTFGDSYVAVFVRMLGLDQDPLDREQGIVALWKYSLGGKKCIDNIMQFHGCLNLTINLLKSDSTATCEAAAGLLRAISSVNLYRVSVAESGAVEEIMGLLNRPSLTSEVKEQSICTLWNLSVDEKLRMKIASEDRLLLLIKFLDDEDIKVKEAAGGVIANLALSHSNHKVMVEAGVIPKLAKFLKTDLEGSKVIRKEARNALLELANDKFYRILVIEEGLVPVPIIGGAAYSSYKPGLHSWPSLPDGTEIEQTSKGPSRFGASELLLGLNVDENMHMEEAKMKAIVGRTQQQFLARIGAIELEDEKKQKSELPTVQRRTLLPWMDGVARLVLILGLEDEVAISRAAESIADASINEHMRVSFKEAGAIEHLVRLLDHSNDAVILHVTRALERLSISHVVCQIIEAADVIHPLVNILKRAEISEDVMEKTLDILARILDPTREMRSKFYEGPVNGCKRGLEAAKNRDDSIVLDEDKTEISTSTSKGISRKDVRDSAFLAQLVKIMKIASPNLQRKATSILEFVSVVDPSMDAIISEEVASGLDAVFQQKVFTDMESDIEAQQPEKYALEVEEAGLAISAASRLLIKLLDSEQFCRTTSFPHLTNLLRKILKSNIPLHNKDWVAACLVKLRSLSSPDLNSESPVNIEVTRYETIPRLIEQIKSSFLPEAQEAAAVELNRLISEEVVDLTHAVAAEGGIFELVKLLEQGSERAVEAALAILYNMSMDSENHLAIIAAGAVPVLRRIVLSERPQWRRALRLLRTLPT